MGVCIPACNGAGGVCPGLSAEGVSGQGGVYPGRCLPHPQADTPPPPFEMATEAGSTHPTGMHPCFLLDFILCNPISRTYVMAGSCLERCIYNYFAESVLTD